MQFSLSQALCYDWGCNPRELRCLGGRGGKTQTDLVSALPNWEEEYVFTRKLCCCKLSREAGVMVLAVDACWHPQKWSPYPALSSSFGAVFFLTLGGSSTWCPHQGSLGRVLQALGLYKQRNTQNKINFRRSVTWSDTAVLSTGTGEAGEAQEQGSSRHGLRGGREHEFQVNDFSWC